jgi:hypothetical protein
LCDCKLSVFAAKNKASSDAMNALRALPESAKIVLAVATASALATYTVVYGEAPAAKFSSTYMDAPRRLYA